MCVEEQMRVIAASALLGLLLASSAAQTQESTHEKKTDAIPRRFYHAVPDVQPQTTIPYLQPAIINPPTTFVRTPDPVPLPKPKPFILPPELDSYPPGLMARARRIRALPPVEYDKPYEGRLIVTRAESQDGVRELCSGAVFRGHALGCRRRLEEGECEIVLASDETIKAVGVIPAVVFRHERGHCNGWGSDHKGARAIVIPAPSAKVK
jgi:hypothetical protein